MTALTAAAAELFNHITADKAAIYRAVMDVFSAAKRQFRLHLRPDEVLAEVRWPGERPTLDDVQAVLAQLTAWGNLQAQPDTARVASIEDFYRKRLLYRITAGGEAVEASLEVFAQTLARRGELQSVALDDIHARLTSLGQLMAETPHDAAKIHEALRDLMHVFQGLSDNAQAFMVSLARTIELQRGEPAAVMTFKTRLIDYLQRFIGDLVTRSTQIGSRLEELEPNVEQLLLIASEREAHDAAPGHEEEMAQARTLRLSAWRERWRGLREWFIANHGKSSQSELLRASALSAIPRLLQAIATLNERRAGRSDRAADFRRLALWFTECGTDRDAHRLWRAAFGLSPARHLALVPPEAEASSGASWMVAPAVGVMPLLRERGQLPTRGAAPRIKDRSKEREWLASQIAHEAAQTDAARQRLATGREMRLSDLGTLDAPSFKLFLALLGDALAAQHHPDQAVERFTADGSLQIRLEPLEPTSQAHIQTPSGMFSGRDHRLLIRRV
ncbi:TIGR02677 family protein [Steroidobacter sp. S1-65]|uniref:TIGR02677 family protein n=1 Tax=Steroidobacter gossypii TaxID=2805490 RepID=A0ABS1WX74_9GAMM|nr:TIGR02677 family protein [Steroidobacter gossypii]MBM0105552.1 TIGR02677 family protein [Steroidobacter gossypii]